MFKSKKIKHIEKVITSCETKTQWLNVNKWLIKLNRSGIISDIQYCNLSRTSFDHYFHFIQDYKNYIRRLNSV